MSMKQLKTQYFEPSLSSWIIIPVHPAHVIYAIFFSQKALRLDLPGKEPDFRSVCLKPLEKAELYLCPVSLLMPASGVKCGISDSQTSSR